MTEMADKQNGRPSPFAADLARLDAAQVERRERPAAEPFGEFMHERGACARAGQYADAQLPVTAVRGLPRRP